MPTELYELFDSRSVTVDSSSPSGQMRWISNRATSDAEVLALALSTAPLTFPGVNGLVRQGVTLEPIGGGVWRATAAYGVPGADGSSDGSAPDLPQQGGGGGGGDSGTPVDGGGGDGDDGAPSVPQPDPSPTAPIGGEFSFTTGGGTERIYTALELRDQKLAAWAQAAGLPLPDYDRAILVNNGNVEGVEVVKPSLEWSVTRTFKAITLAYIRTLSQMTGTTNITPFYGFEAGELLFLGADGRYVGPDGDQRESGWSITFKFAAGQNRTNVSLPEGMTVDIRAWEFPWVDYAPNNDTGTPWITSRPKAAFVDRVYREKNFKNLGI
jgi:hypothetical protein